jgi:hypothetical protein
VPHCSAHRQARQARADCLSAERHRPVWGGRLRCCCRSGSNTKAP